VTTGFTAGVSGRGAAAVFTGSFHQQSHVHSVQKKFKARIYSSKLWILLTMDRIRKEALTYYNGLPD
jgi:hypothetical protein